MLCYINRWYCERVLNFLAMLWQTEFSKDDLNYISPPSSAHMLFLNGIHPLTEKWGLYPFPSNLGGFVTRQLVENGGTDVIWILSVSSALLTRTLVLGILSQLSWSCLDVRNTRSQLRSAVPVFRSLQHHLHVISHGSDELSDVSSPQLLSLSQPA